MKQAAGEELAPRVLGSWEGFGRFCRGTLDVEAVALLRAWGWATATEQQRCEAYPDAAPDGGIATAREAELTGHWRRRLGGAAPPTNANRNLWPAAARRPVALCPGDGPTLLNCTCDPYAKLRARVVRPALWQFGGNATAGYPTTGAVCPRSRRTRSGRTVRDAVKRLARSIIRMVGQVLSFCSRAGVVSYRL